MLFRSSSISKRYVPNKVHSYLHVNSRKAWTDLVFKLVNNGSVEPKMSVILKLAHNWESLLTTKLVGKTAINISNIFCTDFSNAYYGMKLTTEKLRGLIADLQTETLIVGQDSYCRQIKKRIKNQT